MCESNIAADNLLQGLVKHGVEVVRSGNVDKVLPHLQRHCLPHSDEEAHEALLKAVVVCGTAMSIVRAKCKHMRYPVVLYDEVCQSAETSAVVPLTRGCRRLVL